MWCEGDKPTFARYRQNAPDFADPDALYARLLRARLGLPRGQEWATHSAFQALYKENPGLVKMHEWIITVCSARRTGGNGFLELDNEAAGNLDEGQDYSLEAVQIAQPGLCPFRRGGHPEYEQANGFYLDSRYIRNNECPVLALANAAGEDFVEGGLAAIRRECDLADGEYPEMGHLAGYVDKHTPLALIECKGTGEKMIPGTKTPLPDLTGNLQGLLMQPRHMFLLETIWPGKELKHLMVYDAERKFLCMGRCGSSLKQTTLRVTENDMYNPAGGLREFDSGFDFTVGKVSMILVKTSRLNEVPLAALCDAELRARKDAKRKAWEMTAEADKNAYKSLVRQYLAAGSSDERTILHRFFRHVDDARNDALRYHVEAEMGTTRHDLDRIKASLLEKRPAIAAAIMGIDGPLAARVEAAGSHLAVMEDAIAEMLDVIENTCEMPPVPAAVEDEAGDGAAKRARVAKQ
jgi:hypothetical protein